MIARKWGRYSEFSKEGYIEDVGLGMIKRFPVGFRKLFRGDDGRVIKLRSLMDADQVEQGWLESLFQKLDDVEQIARDSIMPPEYRPADYSWRDELDLDQVSIEKSNRVLVYFSYQDPDPGIPFAPMVDGVFENGIFSVNFHQWVT